MVVEAEEDRGFGYAHFQLLEGPGDVGDPSLEDTAGRLAEAGNGLAVSRTSGGSTSARGVAGGLGSLGGLFGIVMTIIFLVFILVPNVGQYRVMIVT